MGDLIAMHDGTLVVTHDQRRCRGQACCIHNPSRHPMLGFPQSWDGDRQLMLRVCPHGRYHPDPDDLSFKARTWGVEWAWLHSTHHCDGCCRGFGRVLRVRWHLAPPINGCRWCGEDGRRHGRLYVDGHGWHGWEHPTQAQIKARLKSRIRADRLYE